MVVQFVAPKVEELFTDYLARIGISSKTFKNYRSDVSHFTGWLLFKVRAFGAGAGELTDAVPFLSCEIAKEYKNFLVENNVPVKTVNRRLSTLRHLAKLLLTSQILDFDFMEGITNVSISKDIKSHSWGYLAVKFQKHLEESEASKSTIKNYASDIRQFLLWLEQKEL